jgi:hypothetical protein
MTWYYAIPAVIVLIIALYVFIGFVFDGGGTHLDLERKTKLLLLSNNVGEIKYFLDSKMVYLTEKSFNALLNRISELNSDNVIFEDRLKDKIEHLNKDPSNKDGYNF